MYKIVSKDLNNNYIYVGSTTDFTKRKAQHKAGCINENNTCYNYKVYKMIRENGAWNEFEMIEIEKYPCNDKNECFARERYWKEYFNANMNTNVPNRSKNEWYLDNKAIFLEQNKKNYIKNKNKILEQHKIYYKKNKLEVLAHQKFYAVNNKEKIKSRQNTKHSCQCGGRYITANKIRHIKSPKHQNYLKNLLDNHDHNMKQIDTFLDDIQNFINNLK
jgi:predicted GIY-YIG superfamily endonuclease